jgi:hypothetical protein
MIAVLSRRFPTVTALASVVPYSKETTLASSFVPRRAGNYGWSLVVLASWTWLTDIDSPPASVPESAPIRCSERLSVPGRSRSAFAVSPPVHGYVWTGRCVFGRRSGLVGEYCHGSLRTISLSHTQSGSDEGSVQLCSPETMQVSSRINQ